MASLVLTVLTIIASALLVVVSIMWYAIFGGFGFTDFCRITLIMFLAILSWLADFGVASMPIDQNLGFLNSGFWRGLCFLLMGLWYFPSVSYLRDYFDTNHIYFCYSWPKEVSSSEFRNRSNSICANGIMGFIVDALSLVVMIIGAVTDGVC